MKACCRSWFFLYGHQPPGSKATFCLLLLRAPYSQRKLLSVREKSVLLFFLAFAMFPTIITFFAVVKQERRNFTVNLFHRFQGFYHVDLFQLPVHEQINNRREDTGDHCAVKETDRAYIPSEHDRIHLYGNNNVSMKDHTKSGSKNDSGYCQKDVFSQHILRNLLIIKSQNL